MSIKIAIVGVGNCASSLVQGLEYYRTVTARDELVPGLMHNELGGYKLGDIKPVAAFDVTKSKVGKDLATAIFATPNNTIKFQDFDPLHFGLQVSPGKVLDGLGKYQLGMERITPEDEGSFESIVNTLKDSGAEILINYLPVGSEQASLFYADVALEAGCAFINCIPVFISSNPEYADKFRKAELPIIGDDIKSQVGATITHRMLAQLFEDRGVRLDRTYQLNFGGNMDFYNMLERDRLDSKKISKTQAVTSSLTYGLDPADVHVGPSDFVPWLNDRKFCQIRMEGTTFGNVPLLLKVDLEVHDSPNSAGVVIDAIRCAKIALDMGFSGPLEGPSAYFMKSPAIQHREVDARQNIEILYNS